LPADLAAHPRITAVGILPHGQLAGLWRTAWATFFPSSVESFGYPLAEARAYGVPVLAPDTAQAREIAGPALRAYDPARPSSLCAALSDAAAPLDADPGPFDRDSYFRWLLPQGDAQPR